MNRIYIKVRPERVFVWPAGELTQPPEVHDSHIEEVRSGHSEEPLEAHEPPTGGAVAWDERIEALGRRQRDRRARLGRAGWLPALPCASRCSLDAGARQIRLDAEPAGLPLAEGRACLTAHSHSPDFNWRENFQVRGDLVPDRRGLGARAAQARGRPGAPEQGPAGPVPGQHAQVAPLLPNGTAS